MRLAHRRSQRGRGRSRRRRPVIAALDSRHQGVRDRLLDGSGALRRHVRVFVNDEDVRALQQEATPLQPGDRVAIVPAIAGG